MITKIQPKIFKDVDPTINENIAAGYSIGTVWHDNVTGIEYTHSLDGIWKSNMNVNADWASTSGDAQILNKPSSFTPSNHASTHVNGSDDIQLATASQNGLMSSTYASKLNGIAAGAEVNVNADWNAVSGDAQILNKPATYTPSAHNHNLSDLSDVNISLEKSIPVDADYYLIFDSSVGYWKKVSKLNSNEIHIGSSAPANNEILWIDNIPDLLTFRASTSSSIAPDFTIKGDKYTSNYSSGNTVSIIAPTFASNKHLTYDDDKTLFIKNIKTSDVTFIIDYTASIIGGITYTFIITNGDEFTLAQNQRCEISYMYLFTSSTAAEVWIKWSVQVL